MAVQATPYVETALSHSAELFRRNFQSRLPIGSAGGVVPATPTTSANITAGVAGCSDLQVSAPGSGMSVNISAGQGIVPGSLGSGSSYGIGKGYGYPTITTNGASAPTIASNAAATVIQLTTQGAYYVYNDDSAGAVNLSVAAADPTNPRIDIVGMQVEDAAYSGSNNDWKLAVVTGTAAASPTVPSFPANFVPLAVLWVSANLANIGSGNIIDIRVAYDRNPFIASVYRNGAWTTGSSVTSFTFDSITTDIAGGFSTGTGLYTCPVGGWWLVRGNVRYTATATTDWMNLSPWKNGAQAAYGNVFPTNSTGASAASGEVNYVLYANATDTIGVAHDCSNAGLTGATSANDSYASFVLLSPQ